MKKVFTYTVFIVAILFFFSSCTSTEEKKASKHLESAKKHIAENSLQNATIELRNVIQIDPDNVKAHTLLGQTYIKLNNQKRGIYYYKRAAELDPGDMEIQIILGQIHVRDDNLIAAREIVDKTMAVSQDNIDAFHLLAAIQIKERNVELAISTMEKAVSIAPEEFKPNMFLAHLYDTSGKKELAEAAYLKTISLDPSRRDPYFELSKLYVKENQWEKAENLLKKMVLTSGSKEIKYTDLAHFYEKQKRFKLAEDNYLNAVASAPESLSAHMNMAEFYIRVNDETKAIQKMEEAAALNKNLKKVFTGFAQIYFHFKEIEKAEEYVEKALGKSNNFIDALIIKGKILIHRDNFSDAYDQFHKIIELDPYNALAYYYKAVCLQAKEGKKASGTNIYLAAAGLSGEPELFMAQMVEDHLQAAIMIDQDFLDARIKLAEVYLAKKELKKAREQIEKILKLKPRGFKVLNLLSELMLLEGDFKSAEKYTQMTLKLQPGYSPGYFRLGLIYKTAGERDKAIASFRTALKIHEDKRNALFFILNTYLVDKNYDDAFKIIKGHNVSDDMVQASMVKYLEGEAFLSRNDFAKAYEPLAKSIELNPDYLPAYMSLAKLQILQKEFDNASILYETILKKNPSHIPALMALGYIFDVKGLYKKAEMQYRKVLSIDPDHVNAANNLAFLLSEQSDGIEEAFALASQARKKNPGNASVLDTMGWILYKKNSFENAVLEFEESLNLDPVNPVTNYHLGLAYYKTRKFELSRKYLQKAIDIDPGFNGAETARQLLNK